jgi:hypothetical protein
MTGSTIYTVQIEHHDSGDLDVKVSDAGSSEADRASIAWVLREAARLVEDGMPIECELFS